MNLLGVDLDEKQRRKVVKYMTENKKSKITKEELRGILDVDKETGKGMDR